MANLSLAENVTNLGDAAVAVNLASDYWVATSWLFAFFLIMLAATYRQDSKSALLASLTLTFLLSTLLLFLQMVSKITVGVVFGLLVLTLIYYIFGE